MSRVKDAAYRPLAVVLDTEKEEATRCSRENLKIRLLVRVLKWCSMKSRIDMLCNVSRTIRCEPFAFDISKFLVHPEGPEVGGRFIEGQYIRRYEEGDDITTVVLPGGELLLGLVDPVVQVVGGDIYTLSKGVEKTLSRNGDIITIRDEVLYDIRAFDGKLFCVTRNIGGTWSVGPLRRVSDDTSEVVALLYSPIELFIPTGQVVNAHSLFFAGLDGATHRIARSEDGAFYMAREVAGAKGQDLEVTPIGSTYAVLSHVARTIEVPGVFKRNLRRFEEVNSIIDADGHCVFSLYDGLDSTFRVVFDDGKRETKRFSSFLHLTAHGSSFLLSDDGAIEGLFGSPKEFIRTVLEL
jgi:hypothetical protein